MQDPIVTTDKTERPKRRSYTRELKAGLVTRCNSGSESLSRIVMEHQINANMLRKWQREAREQPERPTLLPDQVTGVGERPPPSGSIEIAIGSVTLRFNGQVDPVSVSTLLNLLR